MPPKSLNNAGLPVVKTANHRQAKGRIQEGHMRHIKHGLLIAARGRWRVAFAASILFAFVGVAHAATSGMVRWTPDLSVPGFGTTTIHLRADVNSVNMGGFVAQNRACTYTSLELPESWISHDVGGWRNGGLCAWFVDYNLDEGADTLCNSTVLCSNPSGSQSFQTDTAGGVWTGNGYQLHGFQFSPAISL